MAVSPTPPPITPLPAPALPTDPEAVFDTKAGVSLTAQVAMVPEINTALAWVAGALVDTKGYKDAAATSAGNAADSATLAGQKAGLADTARQGAEAARASSEVIAASVQAAAGTPSLAGNKNKVLTVNPDELTLSWKNAGQQIGDILVTANTPGAEYKPADGSIYLQSAYADWVAKFGQVAISPPTTKIANPSTLPLSGYSYVGCSFDATGTYLAIASNQASGSAALVQLYKRSGDTFTALTAIAPPGLTNMRSCVLSPDATHLVATYFSSPYLEVYKRTGDVFSKIADPAVITANDTRSSVFSADGAYLAVGYASSPYYGVYKRAGDVFTKLTTPAPTFAQPVFGMSFSGDGAYLALAQAGGAGYLSLVKRSGDTFSNLVSPAVMPTTVSSSCSFSYDGNYLAVMSGSTGGAQVYKRSGDTFTRIQEVSVGASGGSSCKFSSDGKYLFTGDSSGVRGFRNDADVYSALVVASPLVPVTAMAAYFDSGYLNSYMVSIGGTSPFIEIRKDSYPFNPSTEFQVPNVTTQNNTPPAANTASNTSIVQVKTYVKMREPA